MNRYTVTVDGNAYEVEVLSRSGSTLSLIVNGARYSVQVSSQSGNQPRALQQSRDEVSGPVSVRAPMPGIVSDLKVSVGSSVDAGTTLLIIEAMKMENPIKAPRSGTVTAVHVVKGSEVSSGITLVELD